MLDTYENDFPSLGLITVQDSETKEVHVIDTRAQEIGVCA